MYVEIPSVTPDTADDIIKRIFQFNSAGIVKVEIFVLQINFDFKSSVIGTVTFSTCRDMQCRCSVIEDAALKKFDTPIRLLMEASGVHSCAIQFTFQCININQ